MKLVSILPIAALAVAVPTWAQPPSDESINQYLQVTQFEKALDIQNDIALQQMSESVWKDALPSPKQGKNLKKRNQIIDIINEFEDKVKQRVFTPQLRQAELAAVKRALKQTYTQEEIDAQIQFDSSPIGQKIVAKNPEFWEQSGRDLADLNARYYAAALAAELPNVMAKFQALQNPNNAISPKSTKNK